MEDYFLDILPLQNFHIAKSENYSEIVAIFLSLDSHNFTLFFESPLLMRLFLQFFKNTPSFRQIKQAQLAIFRDLQNASTQEIQEILHNLLCLEKEGIIKNTHFLFLKSLLEKIQKEKDSKVEKRADNKDILESFSGDFLEKSVAFLKTQKEILKSIDENVDLEKFLKNITMQKYSLGVSGVLSAGKSTFLNALLQKEILGSSTIPETASLTLLRYGEKSYAKIVFWNKEQWEDLQKYTDFEALLSNKEFRENVEKYIHTQSFVLEIEIKDLARFTSANDSSKLCNLVKETILFEPLEILKNNVEIVDTPGLDDPIFIREEITKNYVKNCDLLIHTMNASQSATQIDIDFILDTLNTSNIARILILLTHKDLLSEEELNASLNYTKETLKRQLLNEMQSADANALLGRLDFIAVASYEALLCKSNPQKAKELGFCYEKSGFVELLEYLKHTLLGGDSIKTKDIIFANNKGFLKVAKNLLEQNTLKQKVLFSTEDEIQALLNEAKQKQENAKKDFLESSAKLNAMQEEIKEYLSTLQSFLTQKLKEAQEIIAQRIFEDICYDLEKGRALDFIRMENILLQGLKDFLVDILRQFTQKLDKKITQIKEKMHSNSTQKYNIQSYKTNDGMLQKTKALIFTRLAREVKSYGKSQKNALKDKIDSIFLESFSAFHTNIFAQSKEVENAIINAFKGDLESVYKEKEAYFKDNEKILNEALSRATKNTQNKEKEQEILRKEKESLQKVLEDLQLLSAQIEVHNA